MDLAHIEPNSVFFDWRLQMLSTDLIVGASAASAFCGLPVRAVYTLSERNLIPVIKLGGRLYFRKSELEQCFSSATNSASLNR